MVEKHGLEVLGRMNDIAAIGSDKEEEDSYGPESQDEEEQKDFGEHPYGDINNNQDGDAAGKSNDNRLS